MKTIFIEVGFIEILIISSIFALIQYLLSIWIESRLENSIKHEYDKKLEDYKLREIRRQKAETVAILFSKWIKYRGREDKLLNNTELINYYEELNRLSFEICIWLEDEALLKDIMIRLTNTGQPKDINEIIVSIRKLVLNNQADKFSKDYVVTWPVPGGSIFQRLFP